VDEPVFEAGQAERIQGLRGAFAGSGRAQPQVERTKGHVFQHRGIEELVVGVLEQQSHGRAQGPEFLFAGRHRAAEADLPGVRLQQAHDDVQQRGLARAVGSVEPDAATGVEAQVSIVQYILCSAGVAKADSLKLKQRVLSHRSLRGDIRAR